jgi:hypothetical protein
MNRVHISVIKHIRDSSKEDGGKIAATFANLTDEQVVRQMFSNYRGRDEKARGLRLTNIGLEMMKSYFHYYEIKLAEGRRVAPNEILYLDRRATLPYFYSNEKIVVFETELGVKLKLADGEIATLIQMEAG